MEACSANNTIQATINKLDSIANQARKQTKLPEALKIRVLIVDDHQLVRTAIVCLLQENPKIKVVGEASSGEEAIEMARDLAPDVILMDILMPGIGGIEATKKVHAHSPKTKILILTAVNDAFHPYRLFEMGALGYTTKDTSLTDIVKAIECVHNGKQYIGKTTGQELFFGKENAGKKTPFSFLPPRELQIASMIMKGIRVNAIGEALKISPKTVNSYRYRIFEKLNIKSDVELVRIAFKYGMLEHD